MDKRTQIIVIAVASVVVLGGAGAYFLTRGNSEADTSAQSAATPAPTVSPKQAMAGGTGTPGGKPSALKPPTKPGNKQAAQAGANKPVNGADPFGGPGPAASTGGINLAGGPGVPGTPKMPGTRNIPFRPDPFKVDWRQIPLPPYVFEQVEPIRIASEGFTPPPSKPVEVREVPTRRVSGIMTGQGAYAILEDGTENPEIVKPGSQTSDGYRVVSINSDSVKLTKKVENYIYTQIVPLSDTAAGATTASFGGNGFPGRGGGPGAPGSFGGGRPGGFGGGRPGGFGGGKGGNQTD